MIETQQEFKYYIMESGNFASRIATLYLRDGNVFAEDMGDLMTADPKNMNDWEDMAKDIVSTITDSNVLVDLEAEKNEVIIDGQSFKHPDKLTGVGIEEGRSFDMEIQKDGMIKVRCYERSFKNGEQIDLKYLRYDLPPGVDTTGRCVLGKALATKLHTPEAIDAYLAKLAARAEETP